MPDQIQDRQTHTVWICDLCSKQIYTRKQTSIRCNTEDHRVQLKCAGITLNNLNNDFSHERKFINSTSTVFESVTIEIWKNDTIASKYLISSVYRPPTALVDALTRFIDEFSGYLDDVQKIYRKAYICGDININLLKINENNNYNTFYESVTSSGFMPQITLPTRLSDTCDTLIDNIFTNNFEKNHKKLYTYQNNL